MKEHSYIGSVLFFKHLILGTFLLALVAAITACGVLRAENQSYRRQLEAVAAAKLAALAVEPPPTPEPADRAEPVLTSESPDYTALYPDFYAADNDDLATVDEEKTVYLTFDDGPSARTGEILDILDRYGIKATFFVVGTRNDNDEDRAMMRRIVEAGHTLGMHSYTHDYKLIYASVEDCLADFYRVYQLIYDATGAYPTILRFPGGSINGYNGAFYQSLLAEVTRRHFVYFDWNVATGDAVGTADPEELARNALRNCSSLRRAMILMHDSGGKRGTVEALPAIIEGYRDAGFTFAALTPEVVPVVFSYQQ